MKKRVFISFDYNHDSDIKESVGGENKVSNIIEKLILKDIKNYLISKEEVNHYDGN